MFQYDDRGVFGGGGNRGDEYLPDGLMPYTMPMPPGSYSGGGGMLPKPPGGGGGFTPPGGDWGQPGGGKPFTPPPGFNNLPPFDELPRRPSPGGPIGQPPPQPPPFAGPDPIEGPPRTGGPHPIEGGPSGPGGGGQIYQMPPWLRGGGASTMPMPPGNYSRGGGIPGGGSPFTMPMPPGNYGGNVGIPGGGSAFPLPMPGGNYGRMTTPPMGQPNQSGLQALLAMLMSRRNAPGGTVGGFGGWTPFGGWGSNTPYSF